MNDGAINIFTVGEVCFAYYLKNFRDYSEGIELYFVKIISIDKENKDEYCTCDIYLGGDWTGNNHKIGRFKDVCVEDLKKIK